MKKVNPNFLKKKMHFENQKIRMIQKIQMIRMIQKITMILVVFVIFIFVISTMGCSKEAITMTRIPKERPAYKVPSHWIPQNPSGIRAASFSIRDEHGHEGEVSILPMPRLHLADVEIVNLWHQQLGIPSATKEEVEDLVVKVKIGNYEGKLFDLSSSDLAKEKNAQSDHENHNHAMRILSAYLHEGEMTWFFKLTGASHLVETEKPAFESFLASFNLKKMQLEFQQRAIRQSPPLVSPDLPELPEWIVPQTWQAISHSSMLRARFSTGDLGEDSAEITVSDLAGNGGGLLANVNRWRRQIGLEAIAESAISGVAKRMNWGELKGTLVDMTGERRVLVAILTMGNRTWFYKMVGSSEAVENQMDAFESFVASSKF